MQSLISNINKCYPTHTTVLVHRPKITPHIINFLTSHLDKSYSKGQSLHEYIKESTHYAIWSLDNIKIHVLCPPKDIPLNQLIRRVLRRISCLVRIFHIQKQLTFWLLPTPNLRYFPQNNEPVDTSHINGGFTYMSDGLIFIFRNEEFPKVMLHETLHHSSIDTFAKWTPTDLMKLYKYWNIDESGCPHACTTDLVPNEAIVETWAELYHIAFLSYEFNIAWSKLLAIEKNWACKQAKMILQYQKDNFPLWREKSHCFSYVVIRASLLHNIDSLLKKPKDLVRLCIDSFESSEFQSALRTCTYPKTGSFRMCIFSDL